MLVISQFICGAVQGIQRNLNLSEVNMLERKRRSVIVERMVAYGLWSHFGATWFQKVYI
jgi:hypothetical protein